MSASDWNGEVTVKLYWEIEDAEKGFDLRLYHENLEGEIRASASSTSVIQMLLNSLRAEVDQVAKPVKAPAAAMAAEPPPEKPQVKEPKVEEVPDIMGLFQGAGALLSGISSLRSVLSKKS